MTKKKRGFGGTCAIVVEQAGSKRKVVADMAEARTLVKRLAERHPTKQVKVTRACSTGRGARGETIAACTGRKCWGALSGVSGTRNEHARKAQELIDEARRVERGGKVRGGYSPKPHERKAFVADLMTRASENCLWAYPYAPADCERTTTIVAMPSSGKSREAEAESRARDYDRKLRARKGMASDEDPYLERDLRGAKPRVTFDIDKHGHIRKAWLHVDGRRVDVSKIAQQEYSGSRLERAASKLHDAKSSDGAVQALRKAAGLSGVRGTPTQHAHQAERHFQAAREELEWLREGPKHTAATKRKLVAKVRRHLDQGAAECSWTEGAARTSCEADVRSIDAALRRAPRGASGVRGTREQHQEQVEHFIRDAEHATDEAKKAKGAKRRGLALRAFKSVEKADAVCGWAGSGSCNESVVELRDEILPMVLTSAAEKAAFHHGFAGTRRKKWKLVEASGRVVGTFPGDTAEDALFVADHRGVTYDEDGLTAHEVKSSRRKKKR